MSECSICIERFNKTTRSKVSCPYCVTEMCRSCIQILVLATPLTPHCPVPTCKAGWSEDFLTDSLTKTFLLKEFKEAKEQALLDMERARLPESQERARRYKDAKALVDHVALLKAQLNDLPERQAYLSARSRQRLYENDYTNGVANNWGHCYTGKEEEYVARIETGKVLCVETEATFKKVAAPLQKRLKTLRTDQWREALYLVDTHGVPRAADALVDDTTAPKSHWMFVMKCPKSDCEGFVGNDWVCGLCALAVCKDCRETCEKDHECDPDTKLSVAALAKEAKPCPKCAASISKIDGCDQMWCTQCQTAFSWRTGAIETRIHNPHYYEWMRRNGTAAVALAPAPVPDCLANADVIPQVQHHYHNNVELMAACRAILHGEAMLHAQRTTAHLAEQEANEERPLMRVKRLVGEITEDVWKDKLQRMDKAKKKNACMLPILEMYVQTGTDVLRGALPAEADRASVVAQILELRNYCNAQLAIVNKRYNCKVPVLT